MEKYYILYKNIYKDKVTYTLSDGSEVSEKYVKNLIKRGKILRASLVNKSDGTSYIKGSIGYSIKVVKKNDNSNNVYSFKKVEDIELDREVYRDLLLWKNNYNKVLRLSGPRQVGKTYILKKFGREQFKHVTYISLGKYLNSDKQKFMNLYNSVCEKLSFGSTDEDLNKKWTTIFKLYDPYFEDSPDNLIIIDEIQEVPEIYNSIRAFNIALNARVAVTGSYLAIAVFKNDFWESTGDYISVELRSLSYVEFLMALGIYDKYSRIKEIDKYKLTDDELEIYKKVEEYYKVYIQIGGYPDVVKEYVKTKNISSCQFILKNLIDSYIFESKRYLDGVLNESLMKNTMLYVTHDLIASKKLEPSSELSFRENNNSNEISRKERANCLRWLVESHIISSCEVYNDVYNLGNVGKPKYYFSDLGILNYFSKGTKAKESEINGMIAENFVFCYLNNNINSISGRKLTNDLSVYSLNMKSKPPLEIDFFITTLKRNYFALEVKYNKGDVVSSKYILSKKLISGIIKLIDKFGSYDGSTDSNGNWQPIYTFPIFAIDKLNNFLENK